MIFLFLLVFEIFVIMTDKEKNTFKKNFLTPCRSVGLRRKSLGTPTNENKFDKLINVKNSMTNSETLEEKKSTTFKRSLLSSPLKLREPLVKKVKTNLKESSPEKSDYISDVQCKLNKQEQNNDDILNIKINKKKENISKKLDEIKNLESDLLNMKQHNLDKLNMEIQKWRSACQLALNELMTLYINQGKPCNMSILLSTLGIPPDLVHYSETEMDFYE